MNYLVVLEREGDVVGIVRDFQFLSLHSITGPLVLVAEPRNLKFLYVKLQKGRASEVLPLVQSEWTKLLPDLPPAFSFLSGRLADQYRQESRLNEVFGASAALSIFLSFIGAVGLAICSANQRKKEFCIRRLLGASFQSICYLTSRELCGLVLASILVAWPLSYVWTLEWLSGFPHRIDVKFWMFLLGGFLLFVTTAGAILWQSGMAVRADPARVLRRE